MISGCHLQHIFFFLAISSLPFSQKCGELKADTKEQIANKLTDILPLFAGNLPLPACHKAIKSIALFNKNSVLHKDDRQMEKVGISQVFRNIVSYKAELPKPKQCARKLALLIYNTSEIIQIKTFTYSFLFDYTINSYPNATAHWMKCRFGKYFLNLWCAAKVILLNSLCEGCRRLTSIDCVFCHFFHPDSLYIRNMVLPQFNSRVLHSTNMSVLNVGNHQMRSVAMNFH
ncbi:hypothetical protein EGR_11113 [Echinococcus granulosus]|uniref:Uncharacterized protein n=1 Tax=Echinococcus granulosus TaxID=6210 RepID=W6TZ10_ECHGR|nr:hypothetical protein EGR_11113 [Echinococcus granulosus]EUB54030.1 hypothetical protein EGR_11113 [Echinococcus granulosus]